MNSMQFAILWVAGSMFTSGYVFAAAADSKQPLPWWTTPALLIGWPIMLGIIVWDWKQKD